MKIIKKKLSEYTLTLTLRWLRPSLARPERRGWVMVARPSMSIAGDGFQRERRCCSSNWPSASFVFHGELVLALVFRCVLDALGLVGFISLSCVVFWFFSPSSSIPHQQGQRLDGGDTVTMASGVRLLLPNFLPATLSLQASVAPLLRSGRSPPHHISWPPLLLVWEFGVVPFCRAVEQEVNNKVGF
jgi:hypothetical protein